MDPTPLFQPSLQAFFLRFGEFCVRYFAIAGGLYGLLYVLFRRRFVRRRIQESFPSLGQLGYEIRWSLSNAACSTLSTLLIYQLIRDGHSSMYFTIADRGWPYFVGSMVLVLVGYDAWLYWEHRLLHTRWLYEHVHAVHHWVGNPSPFASFAHHPVETFMGNTFFILFTTSVPIHPLALAGAGAYIFYTAMVAHLGYELYPRRFTRLPFLGLLQTATYHNIHHREMRCNYGAWFIVWDRLMGTEQPGYHDAFEHVRA
jgi:sterol desaturase/sphingolipid hydroxylase (fatty acid hydroxylase superfamily)